jgi:hypothetical protein
VSGIKNPALAAAVGVLVAPPNPALSVFVDECSPPDTKALRWLLDSGVGLAAIGQPFGIHVGRVEYEPTGRYVPNPIGVFAFILPAFDVDGLADAVAWEPATGRVATRLGAVGVLGQEQVGVDGRGLYGRAIHVHKSPLNWLRHHRRGVVIVDRLEAAHALAGLTLGAEDSHHRKILEALRTPPPTVVISDMEPAE